MAGALGFLVWRKVKIPYVVESFEPHADYMLESAVWKVWDPRYWIQRFFEKEQMRTAAWLLPVAKNYSKKLIAQGVPSARVITMPCCLNIDEFSFSSKSRELVRSQLGIDKNMVVGIYAGKFGGIYYDKEAYNFLRSVQEYFGKTVYLIILTDKMKRDLMVEFENAGISLSNVHISFSERHEVPQYLSAADFAFTFYRKTPSKKFLSPIKVGEYWANGLPVLMESGIGDDAQILLDEDGGLLCDVVKGTMEFNKLQQILSKGREALAKEINPIAVRHRDMSIIKRTYSKIIGD
jgi:hypothetical protein